MFVAADHLGADLLERHLLGRVEHPQLDTGGHQSHDATVYRLFGEQALLYRIHHELIGAAAVHVAAVLHGKRRRFDGTGGDLVVLVEVPHRPAVRDHVAVEAPLLPEDIHQQQLAAAARLVEGPVVGPHHRLDPGFHQSPERGQVGFPQVLLVDHRVEGVPQRLRPGVDRIVLGAGRGLHVFGVVPLQPLHERRADQGGEEGVLAVGLVAPAPAGVTKYVYIGSPEGESLILAGVSFAF